MFVGVQDVDFQVEVRGGGVGVAGAAYVRDYFAAVDYFSLLDAGGVVVEVGVVVAVMLRGIELVDGVAAGFTEEELFDFSVIYG